MSHIDPVSCRSLQCTVEIRVKIVFPLDGEDCRTSESFGSPLLGANVLPITEKVAEWKKQEKLELFSQAPPSPRFFPMRKEKEGRKGELFLYSVQQNKGRAKVAVSWFPNRHETRLMLHGTKVAPLWVAMLIP